MSTDFSFTNEVDKMLSMVSIAVWVWNGIYGRQLGKESTGCGTRGKRSGERQLLYPRV